MGEEPEDPSRPPSRTSPGPYDAGKRTCLAPGVRNAFICLWQEVNAPDDAAVAVDKSHVVPPEGPPHVPSCLFNSTVCGEQQ